MSNHGDDDLKRWKVDDLRKYLREGGLLEVKYY